MIWRYTKQYKAKLISSTDGSPNFVFLNLQQHCHLLSKPWNPQNLTVFMGKLLLGLL